MLDDDSWIAWRTLLIAAMGEPLAERERTIFRQFTGREREPGERVEECAIVKGRRAGGSRSVSVLAAYIAGLCEHPALVPGERGVLLIVAADQRQADVVLDYTEAAFSASPVLRQLIEARTARELRLTNRVDIEVRAADFRRLRGLTYVGIIADEAAFWSVEGSANPDTEILASVRSGLATTSGPLIMISSPYARRGELWRTYNKHFGPNGDRLILVAQGSSRQFNPTLPQAVVDRAYERDPAAASAEYGAEFRRDIESFVALEAIEACVSRGVFEGGPVPDVGYRAFADPSGGASDSMTLSVAHPEQEISLLDCLREAKPPFSPEAVVAEFAATLRSYRCSRVYGDRFGGEWPREMFRKYGIEYVVASKNKSGFYGALLPLINSRRCDLLDHPKMLTQLAGLERRTARGGRDSIDHAPNQHDDLINAAAGAIVTASRPAIDYNAIPWVVPFYSGQRRYIPGQKFRGRLVWTNLVACS
jgi:hypothetical protein